MRILRLLLAIVVALLSGTLVNSALVAWGHRIIPLPGGLSADTPEALNAAIPLMHTEHFLFPFLAHAAGSFVAALLAHNHRRNHKGYIHKTIEKIPPPELMTHQNPCHQQPQNTINDDCEEANYDC